MQNFENSPEAIVIKDALREFFMGIIENIKGAFIGFAEWIMSVRINLPPMLKFFGNGKFNALILIIVFGYIIFANIKTYILFKKDKQYAQEDEYRIPEWRLLANIWLGGAIGAMFGIYKLRHKTRHKSFVASAWICSFLYLLLFSVIFGFLSFWTFL
ncbi:MAG: DUF1294 domain-containing protein [Clostridia bacterium]|nr:DUF1294 domain-containing protein [Clostridia bacterium]